MAERPIECPRCKSTWSAYAARVERIGASGRRIGKPGALRSCAECAAFYILRDDGSVSLCGARHKAGMANTGALIRESGNATEMSGIEIRDSISGDPRGGTARDKGAFDADIALLD
jgi:hypothetical protein